MRATAGLPGPPVFGVAASSAGNLWAVGSFDNGATQALAVHCC
jgi:hypothetical protein